MNVRKGALIVTGLVLAGAVLLVLNGDRLKPLVFQLAMPTDYFEPERARPDAFVTIAPGVFAFSHGFNRSLVLDCGEKLAVFDSFNGEHAARLAQILARELPGKPVGWVVYSHHHLDHIRGAGALAPESVIAHEDVMSYVRDFDYVDDVLPVSSTIAGDTELVLGSVRVQLLYLPRSHSETLVAAYIPEKKVLFLPDLMFKDAVPPFGFPDWYYPGYIRALDRLLTLDAEHYVPTHFGIGRREDLLAYREFMVDFREEVLHALAKYDYDAADGSHLREALRAAYPVLAAKHGDRAGFDVMFIPHFGGQAGGDLPGVLSGVASHARKSCFGLVDQVGELMPSAANDRSAEAGRAFVRCCSWP